MHFGEMPKDKKLTETALDMQFAVTYPKVHSTPCCISNLEELIMNIIRKLTQLLQKGDDSQEAIRQLNVLKSKLQP